MLIRIDPSRDVPLWEQIAASVRSAVAGGRLRAGDRLPSAREVADALDLNLHTALHAYQHLRDEGVIDLRRGRGAVVTDAAAALRGRWREDGTLRWELSGLIKADPARSTRGMDEPTFAELSDGRVLAVLRGS